MGRSKKPFIDKKNSSTYHLLYSGDGETSIKSGVVLFPSPENNRETDQKILPPDAFNKSTLANWEKQLKQAGLVDDYDYEQHMKPITGTGKFLLAGNTSLDVNPMYDPRSQTMEDRLTDEAVGEQLPSITLYTECMDDDIAAALYGDFEDGDFEELNDDFVLDAAKEPEEDGDDDGEVPFDFASHVRTLLERAKLESEETKRLAILHEHARHDQEFFAKAKPLKGKGRGLGEDDDDDSGYFDDDGEVDPLWQEEDPLHEPGVVPQLSQAEEKALCDKFNETLAEYDSDDYGEGYDDEDAVGLHPLEGNKQIEAALDDFLMEKKDEIFMKESRHYMDGNVGGGSGFSVLVGTRMVPAKALDEENLMGPAELLPIDEVLADANMILSDPLRPPPTEEILIDGKSYFSEKMRNPWDCESILSTYSNLDNNPVVIGAEGRRRRRKPKNNGSSNATACGEEPEQQIRLSEKTGLPLGVLPSRGPAGGGEETYVSLNKGEARKKNENTEEKKDRKLNVKKERKFARMQKKMMKQAFSDEFNKRSTEVLADDVGGKTVFRF